MRGDGTRRGGGAARWGSTKLLATGFTASSITLTLDEIGELVGGLPASALAHRAWWANEQVGRHVQARAWLGAGFTVAEVAADRVVFERLSPQVVGLEGLALVASAHGEPGEGHEPQPPIAADGDPADLAAIEGDAPEQRAAELLIVAAVAEILGVPLQKQRLRIDGAIVELDGYSSEPPVLVEAWAHQGRPRPAQKHKVMTDALKLAWIEREAFPDERARKILALADAEAARHFLGGSWMAAALRSLEISVLVVDLATDVRVGIAQAQVRQYR